MAATGSMNTHGPHTGTLTKCTQPKSSRSSWYFNKYQHHLHNILRCDNFGCIVRMTYGPCVPSWYFTCVSLTQVWGTHCYTQLFTLFLCMCLTHASREGSRSWYSSNSCCRWERGSWGSLIHCRKRCIEYTLGLHSGSRTHVSGGQWYDTWLGISWYPKSEKSSKVIHTVTVDITSEDNNDHNSV